MSTPRIVVTGIGASTPLGGTAPESWSALLGGVSGARTLEYDWVEKYQLPGHLRRARRAVRPDTVLERPDGQSPRPSRAVRARRGAERPGRMPAAPTSTPSASASTSPPASAGCRRRSTAWDTLKEKGPRRVMPMSVPMLMPNAPAAAISMHLGARAYARTVASACASSTESLVNAFEHPAARPRRRRDRRRLRGGDPPARRSPRSRRCRRSPSATTPPRRPRAPTASTVTASSWARAPPALVLETEEHAKARGREDLRARSSAAASPPIRTTSPLPSPRASARPAPCVWRSSRPERTADDVTHINAHATSTPTGDIAEYKALLSVFGDRIHEIPVSATKASTGHLLGGTGALEAIFTILALRDRQAPPTINLSTQDPEIPLRISGSPIPLGDGPAAGDQQLVRLRRPQRRRRVPLGLTRRPTHTKTPPGSQPGASVVSGGDSRSRCPGSSSSEHGSGASHPPESCASCRRTARELVSRPCAARRPARRRSRGGTARARRPTRRRGRRAARAELERVAGGDLHRVADAVLADRRRCRRNRSARSGCRDPACAASGRRRCGAWGPRSPRSAGAPSRGWRWPAPRRCRRCPPSRTRRGGCPARTGCSAQSKLTPRPSARPTAHSRWGHNARGAE